MVCPVSQRSDVSLRRSSAPEKELGGTFSVAYGYRSYSPELGRWVNQDPIGERGGENLCHFVRNNPVFYIDFVGLLIYYLIDKEYLKQNEEAAFGPDGPSKGLPTIEETIDDAIKKVNYGLKKTGQVDLMIKKIVISSLDDLKSWAEKGKPKDHFIVHTHGSGTGLWLGGTHYEWNVEALKKALEAFKGHCTTISFRVCKVAQTQAEFIQSLTGADNIYFNPGIDEKGMYSFDLVPKYAEGGFLPESYEYKPSEGGLKCLATEEKD